MLNNQQINTDESLPVADQHNEENNIDHVNPEDRTVHHHKRTGVPLTRKRNRCWVQTGKKTFERKKDSLDKNILIVEGISKLQGQ